MTEHEQKHVDNFIRDFEYLLRRYNAVYKSTGFKDYTFPQIMFMGVPDDKGDTFLNALIVDLPNTIASD